MSFPLGHMDRRPPRSISVENAPPGAAAADHHSRGQVPIAEADAQLQAIWAAKRVVTTLAAGYHFDILIHLSAGPRCASELARAIGVSPSTMSQNLKDLRSLNLVGRTRVGQSCVYRLEPKSAALIADALREFIAALDCSETSRTRGDASLPR